MTVVLGPGWPGVMIHEAVGHGLEGDFNAKRISAFSAAKSDPSVLGRIGQQVASPEVTVIDDGIGPVAPRLDKHRRRRLADPKERADRPRHPDQLYAGHHQRPENGRRLHRQRTARGLLLLRHAAHDQHLSCQRPAHARGNHQIRRARHPTPSNFAAGGSRSKAAISCLRCPKPTRSSTASCSGTNR